MNVILKMVRFVIENLGDSFCIHEVIALLEQTNRAIFLAHDTSIKVPGGVKDWGEYKAYMSDIRSAANAVIDPSQFDHLRPDPEALVRRARISRYCQRIRAHQHHD